MNTPAPTPFLIDEAKEVLVRAMLEAIGEDPNRPGLRDTPKRVVKAWRELFGGYRVDVEKLFTVFDENHRELVVLKGIEFSSFCEHHLLPFYGRASIGYLPNGKVVGVSKLARVLDAYARRLQIQERLGAQIADALVQYLQPEGCGVILEAQHSCMTCRGVGKQHSVMTTSSMRGSFLSDATVRGEFLAMV